ncbi:exported hypothetical protein [Magnetospirillum sp. UT-4]|nr:exported hypothetical protein [Magnetospirillum sp. UT-4]
MSEGPKLLLTILFCLSLCAILAVTVQYLAG